MTFAPAAAAASDRPSAMVVAGSFGPARRVAQNDPARLPHAVARNSQPKSVGLSPRTSRTNEGAARMYAKKPQKLAAVIKTSAPKVGLRPRARRLVAILVRRSGTRLSRGSVSGSQRQQAASKTMG